MAGSNPTPLLLVGGHLSRKDNQGWGEEGSQPSLIDVTPYFRGEFTQKITRGPHMRITTCSLVALAATGVTLPAVAQPGSNELSEGAFVKESQPQTASETAARRSRLASADGPVSRKAQAAKSSSSGDLEEVIVTAQKRSENLQDVPMPVTVLAMDKLVNNNQVRFEDYYSTIPGVSVTPSMGQSFKATMRGLSSGDISENPTVAVTIDDIPYGSATRWGGGQQIPDVDPGDLARIEVLRGPQGTLYGASSLGGLIKFVTVDPSTEGFSGRIQVGASGAQNSNDVGYTTRGSVNIPLSDGAAIRASAFVRQDPGYIDNILLGKRDANGVTSKGGRLAALWNITEALTAKFSAQVQRIETEGAPRGELTGDNPTQSKAFGDGAYTKDVQAFGATLTAKMGTAELTSVTAYDIFENKGTSNITPVIGYRQEYRTHKLSEELRLAMPLGQRVDWLLGAFYTKEDPAEWLEDLPMVDPTSYRYFTPSPLFYHAEFTTTHNEYALFSSLLFNVTDRFDVQVAGRQAHYDQDFYQIFYGVLVGAFNGGNTHPTPYDTSIKEDAFTYLVTPRFKITPDLMVYARFASGYRTGSPNSKLVPINLPIVKPDTTRNYELGLKGNFFDRKLTLDASVYYIDWKDIQLNAGVRATTASGDIWAAAIINGSRAKSQGVELSVTLRPLESLNGTLWVALNDGTLTEDIPSNVRLEGHSGDRLPDGARLSGGLSLEQRFVVTQDVTGYLGGTVSYQGRRSGPFQFKDVGVPRRVVRPYGRTDLSGGVQFGDWDVGVYCNNVFNRFESWSPDPVFGDRLISQPRSFGMSLTRTF